MIAAIVTTAMRVVAVPLCCGSRFVPLRVPKDLFGKSEDFVGKSLDFLYSCFLKFCTLSAALMLSGSSFQRRGA